MVLLLEGLEEGAGDATLRDAAAAEVHELVAVGGDVGEEAGDAGVRPVHAEGREDVAEDVGAGDGAVNIADDEADVPVEEVDERLHALAADAELDGVLPELQVLRHRLQLL